MRWKWACKTRRWGPRRPRPFVFCSRRDRNRDLTRFFRDRDVPKQRLKTETETSCLHWRPVRRHMLMEKPYHLVVYEAP